MPYRSISELPPGVRKNLPAGAQRIFLEVVNGVLGEGGGDETSAFRQAWGAVERAGYYKGGDGRWRKKELAGAAQKGVQGVTTPAQIVNEYRGKEEARRVEEPVSGGPVFGGATSFEEYDDYVVASDSSEHVEHELGVFQQLVENVKRDETVDVAAKAMAIEQLAVDLKERVLVKAVRKTEGGAQFPAEDYAYVPDPAAPSTWKLRLTENPGKPTVAQVARAITALQPGGFRGNRVDIPSADKAGVVRKITAAIGKIDGADDAQRETLRERLSAVKEEKSFDTGEFWKALGVDGDAGDLPDVTEEVTIRTDDDGVDRGTKVGRRLRRNWVTRLKDLAKSIGEMVHWAEYDEGEDEETEEGGKAGADSGFKVFKERSGKLRWIGYSSNAFKDRHNEIFSTKSLLDAVERSDKSGERGPLLLYHVSEAAVGTCDFQAVEGRFLVESGTFDDTELGRKAARYFGEHTGGNFGLSVGYEYRSGDRRDKVYDWMNVFERSITPSGRQANPWCEFSAVATGGKQLDREKLAFLTEVFGEDTAKKIVEKAAFQTKELEKTVDFKADDVSDGEKADDPLATMKACIKRVGDKDLQKQLEDALGGLVTKMAGEGAKDEGAKDEGAAETTGDDTGGSVKDEEAADGAAVALRHLVDMVTDVTGRVGELGQVVAGMQESIKELQRSEDEKISGMIAPRARIGRKADETQEGFKEDSEAVQAVKKALNGNDDDGSPVAGHVKDLTRLLGGAR